MGGCVCACVCWRAHNFLYCPRPAWTQYQGMSSASVLVGRLLSRFTGGSQLRYDGDGVCAPSAPDSGADTHPCRSEAATPQQPCDDSKEAGGDDGVWCHVNPESLEVDDEYYIFPPPAGRVGRVGGGGDGGSSSGGGGAKLADGVVLPGGGVKSKGKGKRAPPPAQPAVPPPPPAITSSPLPATAATISTSSHGTQLTICDAILE